MFSKFSLCPIWHQGIVGNVNVSYIPSVDCNVAKQTHKGGRYILGVKTGKMAVTILG